MEQFSLHRHEQCLLIPSYFGNDSIKPVNRAMQYLNRHFLYNLGSFHSIDPEISENFEKAKKFYSCNLPKDFFCEYDAATTETENDTTLPL